MILKKLIFFVAAAVLQPSSSYWHSSSDILPPKKPTKPTLKVPTLFLFCFGRIMNHLSDLFVEISFGYPFFGAPGLIWISPTAGCTKLSQMERFGSAPASKVRLLDPFGGRKKTEDGLFPRKVFLEIFGEKREGRVFRIFQDFFHLYMTTLFFVGYLFCFFRGFTRPRWQLHRFPFRTTTSSLFFCPLAVKNNRGGRGTYMASFLWTELVMNWEKRLCSILGGCEYVYKIDVVVDCLLVVLVGSCFPWL